MVVGDEWWRVLWQLLFDGQFEGVGQLALIGDGVGLEWSGGVGLGGLVELFSRDIVEW